MNSQTASLIFPFGRPVSVCKASASGAKQFFILGAYPSALHIRWTLPDLGKLKLPPDPANQIKAIAVENEPEPFWSGGENEKKLIADWKQAVGWKESWGKAEPAGALNGSSGVWVDDKVIKPICKNRASVWITDSLDTYRCSSALAKRIENTYKPFAERLSLPMANLLRHPSENEIVEEAREKQHDRLVRELSAASPEVIITLGNAAFRVLKELIVLVGTDLVGSALSDKADAYGRKFKVRIGSRLAEWLPLAHPAAPKAYQTAHEAWLVGGMGLNTAS